MRDHSGRIGMVPEPQARELQVVTAGAIKARRTGQKGAPDLAGDGLDANRADLLDPDVQRGVDPKTAARPLLDREFLILPYEHAREGVGLRPAVEDGRRGHEGNHGAVSRQAASDGLLK